LIDGFQDVKERMLSGNDDPDQHSNRANNIMSNHLPKASKKIVAKRKGKA